MVPIEVREWGCGRHNGGYEGDVHLDMIYISSALRAKKVDGKLPVRGSTPVARPDETSMGICRSLEPYGDCLVGYKIVDGRGEHDLVAIVDAVEAPGHVRFP